MTENTILRRKNGMTLQELLIKLTILFPVSTLLERYLSFANKILLFFIVGVLFFIEIKKQKIKYKKFFMLTFFFATFLFSFILTPIDALKLNPNMAVYYIFLIIYYPYIVENKETLIEHLQNNKKYILYIVTIYTVILTITIFLPWSYMRMESGGWGNDLYFASFSNSPNRVGPACMYILVLLLFLQKNRVHTTWLPFLVLPHLYAAIAGGSRTYFVLILCLITIYLYYWLKPKKLFWLIIIPAIFILAYLVYNSSMMTKIEISLSYISSGNTSEFWRRLSNSRSILWPQRINAFKSFAKLNKFFGAGINYTTDTFGLWSHNDFIEILCSYGYFGLFNYILVMFILFKSLLHREMSLLVRIMVLFLWLFNAFVNFFYCYFNAVLCYPILLLILYSNKNSILQKTKETI